MHNIHGFIASFEDLNRSTDHFSGARVVPLALGFGFMPVDKPTVGQARFERLERLTTQLGDWAKSISTSFPIAYIETDYFGGIGEQAAVTWVSGCLTFGPFNTKSYWEDDQFHTTPLLDGVINRAVRLLGVDRGNSVDEFDALGLGRHRSNESWLSEVV